MENITKRRRLARRPDVTLERFSSGLRFCSRQFYNGVPFYEMVPSDSDWAPSLNLGYDEGVPSNSHKHDSDTRWQQLEISKDHVTDNDTSLNNNTDSSTVDNTTINNNRDSSMVDNTTINNTDSSTVDNTTINNNTDSSTVDNTTINNNTDSSTVDNTTQNYTTDSSTVDRLSACDAICQTDLTGDKIEAMTSKLLQYEKIAARGSMALGALKNDKGFLPHQRQDPTIPADSLDPLKPEVMDDCLSNLEEEKPCIAALRASVETYMEKQRIGERDTLLEPSDTRQGNSSSCSYFEPDSTPEDVSMKQFQNPRLLNTDRESADKHLGSYEEKKIAECGQRISTEDSMIVESFGSSKDRKPQAGMTQITSYISDEFGSTPTSDSSLIFRKKHLEERLYKCDFCEKSYLASGQLTIHLRVHSGEKPYKCNECDKSFSSSGYLTFHKRCHLTERPFKCDGCDKSFYARDKLTIHQRVHSGERPYKCDECDKSFRTSDKLTIHQRIHSGERPYKCGVCDASFSNSSNLNKHCKRHSTERPYKCETCDKSFKTNGTLTVHKKVHSGIRPYKCDYCYKSFSRKGCLNKHKKLHTGEKPYKCVECGESFSRKDSLSIHRRLHLEEIPYKSEEFY